MENKYLTTQELADKVGVSAITVRRWHEQGKLVPHHQTPSGRRFYTEEQAEAILNAEHTESIAE